MDNKELNISIFSYNVFWKIMKKNIPTSVVETLDLDTNNLNKKSDSLNIELKRNKLKKNILQNILNVKNYYNPFIYCFQESESSDDIIKLFEKTEYCYHLGYSEPEHILTIWRKDIMKKKIVLNGEFEKGRPFSIIIFKDMRFKVYWMLRNIHEGHNFHTNTSIFEPIQNLINLNKNKLKKYDIKRIAIIGDFNRDISSQIKIEPQKYELILNKKKFNLNCAINNTNKTCCSLKGWGYKLNYDQLIDSYSNPLLVYQLNKESWYISESSDHLAILSVIKNLILDN